ncbi:hypothetical protein ACIBCH_03410 [Amycolatopsis thailandensis]|uniref:hypothetical protein n=1 Tax=Amycolatopsis thailandensis TaxID=589330 RepID=UPI0037B19E48
MALTFNEPDVAWLQTFLLECLNSSLDIQIRALAVTCVGHVARLHGEVSDELVSKLREMLEDPVLGGQVEDAFDDISAFVPGGHEL